MGITEEIRTTNEPLVTETGEKESSSVEELVKQKTPDTKTEEKSGIRRRIKIKVPGLINTDKSDNRPPCELLLYVYCCC